MSPRIVGGQERRRENQFDNENVSVIHDVGRHRINDGRFNFVGVGPNVERSGHAFEQRANDCVHAPRL